LELNSHVFAECLHTNFEVCAAGGPVPLELAEVNQGNFSPRVENFSLIFRGPMSPFFPQGMYRLNHQKLGEIDIFLVPMGPNRAAMEYEAVFNRLLDGSK
jgi:hypothetical protein